MGEDRLKIRNDRIEEALISAYRSLEAGCFARAVESFEWILGEDFGRTGVASMLKCSAFWRERQEKGCALTDTFEKGEYYLSQWKAFRAFIEDLPDIPERFTLAVKSHVFMTARESFLSLLESDGDNDPEVLVRLGMCSKSLGRYAEAIDLLEQASRQTRGKAEELAELADCYAMVDETRTSKAFFREAFFLDPQAIDLAGLESPLIHRLAERLRRLGFHGPQLNEWLPVYGTIYGVFNVTRKIKPVELGKLKQSILALEKEISREPDARGLVPRLINRYFWLIDHFLAAGESRGKIEEVLSRIKELDPIVYRDYAA
jgi:tetratricopeptide (TPR) repeat protein